MAFYMVKAKWHRMWYLGSASTIIYKILSDVNNTRLQISVSTISYIAFKRLQSFDSTVDYINKKYNFLMNFA